MDVKLEIKILKRELSQTRLDAREALMLAAQLSGRVSELSESCLRSSSIEITNQISNSNSNIGEANMSETHNTFNQNVESGGTGMQGANFENVTVNVGPGNDLTLDQILTELKTEFPEDNEVHELCDEIKQSPELPIGETQPDSDTGLWAKARNLYNRLDKSAVLKRVGKAAWPSLVKQWPVLAILSPVVEAIAE